MNPQDEEQTVQEEKADPVIVEAPNEKEEQKNDEAPNCNLVTQEKQQTSPPKDKK